MTTPTTPDPTAGMRIGKCPHCGEELSIWPDAPAEAVAAYRRDLAEGVREVRGEVLGEFLPRSTVLRLIEETP